MKDLDSRTQKLQEPKGKEDKMNKAIRILLVDGHELIRQGLQHMLESEENMEVVGDCANAEETFSKMARLRPDIVLMDIQMPGMDGIEAIRSLKRNGLDYGGDVIILADSANRRVEALQAGATRYLLKDVTRVELVRTIREIHWSKQLSGDRDDFVERAVDLVVPPPANAARLLSFMCQLEERLHDNHNSASIMRTVGSWDWGTVITILVWPTLLVNLLERLENMPEVEKVEEEPTTKGALLSFPKKFRALSRSNIGSNKRIRVTLKETTTARQ